MYDTKKLSQSINIVNNKMNVSQDLSKSFSFRHATCKIHSSNYIVNFCVNPECLKPMCSECIKAHTKEHAAKGTHG